MTWIDFRLEVDFEGEFFTESKWVDVTDHVDAASFRRGRSHVLGRVEAGTAKFTLIDGDRRFDPTNPDSPYQPDLVPARPIRFAWLDEQGAPMWLFHGLVNAWPTEWHTDRLATVELDCSDDYRQLAAQGSQIYRFATLPEEEQENLPPFWQPSGTRIGRLLDLAGWPGARRRIDEGQARIWIDPAAAPEGRPSILEGIEECVTAEGGAAFMGGDGAFVFHNRHRRLLPGDAAKVIFGGPGAEGDAEIPCEVTPATDDAELRNRITTQSPAHDDYRVQDDASADRYYRRTYEQPAPWWHRPEQIDRAHWLKDAYAESETRITELSWRPDIHPEYRHRAALDIGDRVVVVVAPYHGEEFRRDYHIEQVRHRMPGGPEWRITYQLSPADERYYWRLGDPVYSRLGTTTRLAH